MNVSDLLVALGWSDHWSEAATVAALNLKASSEPGRVIRHDGALVTVATDSGLQAVPVLATISPAPIVGDWVLISDVAVRATLDRRSLLRRRDTLRDTEQPIVANVDTVFIVCGVDRPVKLGRIQRAASLAADAGAEPVVVLTKADKSDDIDAVRNALDEGSIRVVVTSVRTGQGVVELRELSSGKTVVLIGESGAGKSRLTNALCEREVALVGDVRAGDSKGRHTTTHRELHLLETGGVLIDTPGIRSVGLWGDADAVDAAFDDIDSFALECKFSNCGHDSEPGCAVAEAVSSGSLSQARVDAWRGLVDEAEESTRRQERKAWRQGEGKAPRNQTRRGRSRVPDDPENS